MNNLINLEKIKFLQILTATVLVELFILYLFRFTKSILSVKAINDWYDNLRWNAVILDLLIFIIGFYLAIFFCKRYKINSYIGFLIAQLLIQIIHDFLFYFYIIKKSTPKNSIVMDEFKSYAKNTGIGAILGDSYMYLIGVPILIMLTNKNLSDELLIFISTVCLYLIGYFVFQKPTYNKNTNYIEIFIPLILNSCQFY